MGRGNSRSRSRGRRNDSRRGRSGGKGYGKKGGSSSQSILVRNMDYSSSPDDVREHFASCGSIKDVYLPLEHQSRKPKGFGFIEFVNAEDAHYAVRTMDHSELHGKTLSVMIAQNRRKSPHTMQRVEYRRHDARGGHYSEPRWGGKKGSGKRGDSRKRGNSRGKSRSRSRGSVSGRKDSRKR